MASYAEKPWLKSYHIGPYKLARSMTYREVPLYAFLDEAAENYADNVAIFYLGGKITYAEMKLYTDKLASALVDLGVEKGDRVAIYLPNCPQLIMSLYGIIRTGAISVPLSSDLGVEELEVQLRESGATALITLDKYLEAVDSVRDKTEVKEVIVTSVEDFSPQEEPEIEEIPGTWNLRKLLADAFPEPPLVEIDPKEDLVALFFTGGSTGLPKAVMHTHFSFGAYTASQIPWILSPLKHGIAGKASIFVPMAHHAGVILGIVEGVYWGLRMIMIPDPWDAKGLVDTIQEFRPFMLFTFPGQLMRLVSHGVRRTQTMAVAIGEPLPGEVADDWRAKTGMPVTQVYALSEVGGMCDLSVFSRLTGFAGKEKRGLGVPCVELEAKVVDPVTGEDVPFGEVGEICIKGPQLMKGYWPTPGKGLIDGWLYTGDLGYMDEDGYFFLVDRCADLPKIEGAVIYTTTVDDALYKHPAVMMAAAVGVPDPEHPESEWIKAFVKLEEEYVGKVTAEEIIEHCKAHLPPQAVPKAVEFREQLPLTVTGKFFKRKLREEEIARIKEKGEMK